MTFRQLAAWVGVGVFLAGCSGNGSKSADRQGGNPPAGSNFEFSGNYQITDSSNPDGSGGYTGTVIISPLGSAYSVDWQLATVDYSGIGVVSGTVLGVGWGATGSEFGVVVYQVDAGILTGRWASGGTGVLGTENLSGPLGLSGNYQITRGVDPSGSEYSGTVVIEPTGETYQIAWNVGGSSHAGVGVLMDDTFVAAWGPEQTGVLAYRASGTNELLGVWTTPNGTALGSENLQRL